MPSDSQGRTQRAPRHTAGLFALFSSDAIWLDHAHLGRLQAFLALHHVEADAGAFGEGLEAVALDLGEVHEHVRAVILLDETETLRVVEPLHGTFCHLAISPVPLKGRSLLCKS